jgi:predicted ATP-dependent endonuclease of OLD family
MANDLRLEISDFRAIGHADIILDGITVIAGENGSGKSTISKLLYHTIKVVNEYDSIIDEQLKNKLRGISSNFKDIIRDYSYVFKDDEPKYEDLSRQFNEATQLVSRDFDDSRMYFINLSVEAITWVNEIVEKLQDSDMRVKFMTSSIFRNRDVHKHIESINKKLKSVLPIGQQNEIADSALDVTSNILIEYIQKLYAECNDKKYNRYIDELSNKLKRQFEENIESINYNIYEHDLGLIERELNKIYSISQIENVIYIDTPMAMGAQDNGNKNEHWNDLNKLLMNDYYSIDDSFSNKIIHGSARFERTDLFRNKFVFKRDDGKEFNLMEVATGVKSFSILQMLLNNGSLNGNTLLILDEPEAHLHPQWIVEYGRFLVYLNKHVGVKLLVASHNPDMVSALKYITEKEGNPEVLNFYLAKQKPGTYLYNYKHLGVEIEDIFSSYNKSFDKLNNYTA